MFAPGGILPVRSLPPQPLACDRGTLAERAQLGPDDAVGHHRVAPDRGAEAAIDAGDQALAVDDFGVAADALRHQPRMLDEIRRRVDDPWNENLVVRNVDLLQ